MVVIYSNFIERPLVTAANDSCANPKFGGFVQFNDIAVRIVENARFNRLSVDQNSHPRRALRTVIGESDMLPLIHRYLGNGFDRSYSGYPTRNDVEL